MPDEVITDYPPIPPILPENWETAYGVFSTVDTGGDVFVPIAVSSLDLYARQEQEYIRNQITDWYDSQQFVRSQHAPPTAVIDAAGNQITVETGDPIERAAIETVARTTSVNDPNFGNLVQGEAYRTARIIQADYPLSGPTYSDIPQQNSDSSWFDLAAQTWSGGSMSFFGDVFDTLGDIFIGGLSPWLSDVLSPRGGFGAPMTNLPVVVGSNLPAVIPRAAVPAISVAPVIAENPGIATEIYNNTPIGMIGNVGQSIGTAIGNYLNGGSNVNNISQVLRVARANRPGATRKSIINGAKHCGIDVTAQMYGLNPMDVCAIVAKGMPRRRRGISASDVRRTRSTLCKINNLYHMMPTRGSRTTRRRKC